MKNTSNSLFLFFLDNLMWLCVNEGKLANQYNWIACSINGTHKVVVFYVNQHAEATIECIRNLIDCAVHVIELFRIDADLRFFIDDGESTLENMIEGSESDTLS